MTARIIIIGAGAAGVAAASRILEQGGEVVVLEARDRIGGRIWSYAQDGTSMPVELGAEFLHGPAKEVGDIARRARLRRLDIAGRRWTSAGGRLTLMDDFWERLDRVMRRLREAPARDRSFADALAGMRDLPPALRQLAVQYVEGFHAADTHLASEAALAAGGSPRDDVRERRIGRILEGYSAVMEALAAPVRNRIRLNSAVTVVRWRPGNVRVTFEDAGGRTGVLEGDAAIVSVPLGVLQAPRGATGAIAFDPPVPALARHATRLHMGHVAKVTLQMNEPFWMTERFAERAGDERLDTLSFLHARETIAFPVWWTTYPVRSARLVAWRGGPVAEDLARLSPEEMADTAIGSLARLLGMTRRAIRARVVAVYGHDWTGDPWSRGAYSYTGVGGADAAKALSRPVERTLYFAGEHADREGRSGTVHGAIASGRSAAERALRGLVG